MALGAIARDELTAQFLDGAARGEFLLRHCTECGSASQPQAQQCGGCGSALITWRPSGGGASVVSWTVIHTKPAEGSSSTSVLVIGQFDEGPWWWSELVGVEPGEVHEGMRLVIGFEQPPGSAEFVPVFRPATRARF
jgi:uncharacterized OB-fold protein